MPRISRITTEQLFKRFIRGIRVIRQIRDNKMDFSPNTYAGYRSNASATSPTIDNDRAEILSRVSLGR